MLWCVDSTAGRVDTHVERHQVGDIGGDAVRERHVHGNEQPIGTAHTQVCRCNSLKCFGVLEEGLADTCRSGAIRGRWAALPWALRWDTVPKKYRPEVYSL